jgi:hypothetical protein
MRLSIRRDGITVAHIHFRIFWASRRVKMVKIKDISEEYAALFFRNEVTENGVGEFI